MKKIEEAMCAAIKAHKNWSKSNTRVTSVGDLMHVYLFDNCIAVCTYRCGVLRGQFTLAGYNTMTTRNRLRALGVYITGNYDTTKAKYMSEEINRSRWYGFETKDF